VRRLLPTVADESEAGVYDDLVLPTVAGRPWVALGMVASVDGAATAAGRTAQLGGVADHHAYRALRGACDAVLVGAGTVRIEGYGPATGTQARRRARRSKGLAPAPRLVIVSASLDLDPASRAFGAPDHPPLVVTHESAPASRQAVLAPVAELLRCGAEEVDLHQALAELGRRGLHRILCEGGPSLNGALARLDAIDEVFLTIDPVLLAGDAPRIARSVEEVTPRRMRLVELREHEGELLLRYRRER
jgi:riboflavin biosynthesis pyrimidine reductase